MFIHMSRKIPFYWLLLVIFSAGPGLARAQVLTLKEAVQTALTNYGTIRAKTNYAKASQANVTEAKREYLPDLSVSAQQDYGTVNMQFGSTYGLGGLGVASAGPFLPTQNSNAAFGSLYLANINWKFFRL